MPGRKRGGRGHAHMNDADLRAQLASLHSDCFGWALACCRRDRDDAEEVLQMAYLAVLDGRARYHERSAFRTWMFGVIRLTAMTLRRRRWLRRTLLARHAHRVDGPAEDTSLDTDLLQRDRAAVLQRALERLSERQRSMLQLVFYHGLTVDDAAEALGISVGSARTHYARGKARLATLLDSERRP
jgi:RNA polymerase sigma factor (sigma-70 family)